MAVAAGHVIGFLSQNVDNMEFTTVMLCYMLCYLYSPLTGGYSEALSVWQAGE